MVEIKVKDFFYGFNSLATRESGLLLRKEVERLLKGNHLVVLDFEGINLITQGFADEVLGVLIRKNGINFVGNKIKIKECFKFCENYF